MEGVRKGLAFIFAILFVISALLALFLFNLERKAFNAETYQKAFANDNFYERLPAILADSLTSPLQTQSLPLAMRGLTAQNWETFIRALLPPETLETMSDEALSSLFAYLNDKADSAQVSLTPLKQHMASDEGTQAVIDLMRTQPDCTLQQITQMTLAVLSQGQISLCNPPEAADGIIRPIIHAQLQLATAAIPDSITLASADSATGKPNLRERLKIARFIMRWSPLLPLGLLFILTLLAVRSLRGWLQWWGFPFLITGFMGLISGLIGGPFVGLVLSQLLARRLSSYLPAILLSNSSQLASAIVGQMLKPVIIESLILGGLGLIMVLITAFGNRKQPIKAR